MNSPRDQLLARSCLAKNHHWSRVTPGHHADERHNLLNNIALPDEEGDILDQVLFLKGLDFFPETAGFCPRGIWVTSDPGPSLGQSRPDPVQRSTKQ